MLVLRRNVAEGRARKKDRTSKKTRGKMRPAREPNNEPRLNGPVDHWNHYRINLSLCLQVPSSWVRNSGITDTPRGAGGRKQPVLGSQPRSDHMTLSFIYNVGYHGFDLIIKLFEINIILTSQQRNFNEKNKIHTYKVCYSGKLPPSNQTRNAGRAPALRHGPSGNLGDDVLQHSMGQDHCPRRHTSAEGSLSLFPLFH